MYDKIKGYLRVKYRRAFKKYVINELKKKDITKDEVNLRLKLAKILFRKIVIFKPIKDIRDYFKQNILYETIDELNIGHRYIDKHPSKAIVNLPPIGFYEMSNVVINPNSPVLYSLEKGLLVRQFYPFPNQLNIKFNSGNLYEHNSGRHIAIINFKKEIDKGIMLTGSNSPNWYHWTIEILSKIVLFNKLPDELRDIPLIVPIKCLKSKNHHAILKLLFPKSRFIGIEDNVLINKCIYIDSPNLQHPNYYNLINNCDKIKIGQKRSEVLKKYRNIILSKPKNNYKEDKPNYQEKIFLARKQNKRPYNQNAVEEALFNAGYTSIYFEEMSVDEQLSHMEAAKFVVGPSGAAWANLLFSNAKSALIWVPSCENQSNTYTKIAQASGTKLYYLNFPTKAKKWTEFMKMKEPYYLDTNKLIKNIELMERI